MIPALADSRDNLDQTLATALKVVFQQCDPIDLHSRLESFYSAISATDLKSAIQLERLVANTDGTWRKIDVLDLGNDGPPLWKATTIWHRRLRVLRQVGIRLDLLSLGRGEQIPPHGHRGVVSGFFVLEGEVGMRSYDVLAYAPRSLRLQRTKDEQSGPGDFIVNSDEKDNVHWVSGIADRSTLFRFNCTGLPSVLPDYQDFAGRVYVDPTVPGEPPIEAPVVDPPMARSLIF